METPPTKLVTAKRSSIANIFRSFINVHMDNPGTSYRYQYNLKMLVSYIREFHPELNEIDDKDERANAAFRLIDAKLLNDFLFDMHSRNYSRNSIALMVKVLRAFLYWVATDASKKLAESVGQIGQYDWAKAENRFKVDITESEMKETLAIAADRSQGFSTGFLFTVTLMSDSGVRPAEALGVWWEDLHIPKLGFKVKEISDGLGTADEYNGIFLRARPRNVCIYGPKGKKERAVPISGTTVSVVKKLLQEVKEGVKPTGRICTDSYRVMDYWFCKMIKDSGIQLAHPNLKITPHKYRHYFFHNFIHVKHGDITIAQKIAGHAKLETTLIYTNPSVGEVMREYARTVDSHQSP
jgi:site-specific recombinase XerD